ncbi:MULTISPECIES: hypothetical protein [unclassified Streptomyces]|uniref:hypothetical protein n=1 Tax=unclassified Streptomyces TaxID=2593676 RepID=UPI002ED57889|nr:hypothetical protein OH827_08585 [Streptomyces sp. NBC_00891]WSY05083.1 hypothetical protein OG464_08585 [Streptomyces sp. NBC_00890]WSZ06707.1 hypothetical protein OG704_08585 [Streptomyces sp. NBC_00869]WSZ25794.1 hypothetical protein OG498_24980 [Streptomyces sp. NBC_00870]
MRAVRAPGRAARREWGPLCSAVRARLAARGPRAVPLTLASVALTALLQVVQNRPWGYGPVQTLGAVRADDPLGVALLRTPLSLFVPALDLPVWGALVQMLVVFGAAEICLGRWRTLLIAYAATLAGTLYARIGIAAGPEAFLGLPASDARVVDTGPSAAVVALAVCVCCAYGARFTGGLVIAAMVAETVFEDNLAGREHLAAIAVALVLCTSQALRGRQGLEGGRGTRSGAPPIRS